MLTPNLFANIEDGSTLLQLARRNNLGENVVLLGALNVAFRPDGSEYGGVPLATSGVFLACDASVFAQLAWYF